LRLTVKRKETAAIFRMMAFDKKLLAKIMIWFGLGMVVIFFGLGIMLIYFPVYTYLPQEIKTIIGIFFIAYGFFRLARVYTQIRQSKNERNNP